jgi:cation:H+ antiporter
MLHSFLILLLNGVAVVAAGVLLGVSGDQIASITGFGEMWTGWIMLAAATSLPEFVTDVSAVRLNSANLAAGDLFGSSLTNMAILAMIVMFPWPNANQESGDNETNLFAAWLAIALTVIGACYTLVHLRTAYFIVRPESLSLVIIWMAGTRILYKQQRSSVGSDGNDPVSGIRVFQRRLIKPLVIFAIGSAVIFVVAPAFANAAREFAAISGLGQSFVGTAMVRQYSCSIFSVKDTVPIFFGCYLAG